MLEKAEEDLEASRRLIEPTPEPLAATAAFHAQQCTENALKAYLVACDARFRKVHNLTYLADECEEEGLDLGPLRDDLPRLIPFAVDRAIAGNG